MKTALSLAGHYLVGLPIAFGFATLSYPILIGSLSGTAKL